MNDPVTATTPRQRKRSVDSPQTAEATNGDTIQNVTPGSSAKKKKQLKTSADDELRAWSNDIKNDASSDNTSTVYTLECIFGNPSEPLCSYIKESKVGFIKRELEMRDLSTEGNKKVLLHRLQTDLPSVTLNIDGRECLQRVVNSMMFHFGWDSVHLFECHMPARGTLQTGVTKLIDKFPFEIGFCIERGDFSANPMDHDERQRKRFLREGWSWDDVATVKENPDAPGKDRKLLGSGLNPHYESPDTYEDSGEDGGWFSLLDLALVKGDEIRMTYDFGDQNTFIVRVRDVKPGAAVLPEVTLYGNETRVNLVGKGNSRMREQYDDGYYLY